MSVNRITQFGTVSARVGDMAATRRLFPQPRAQGLSMFLYGHSYTLDTGVRCTSGLEYHKQLKTIEMMAATSYGVSAARIFDSALWMINGGASADGTAAPSGAAWATIRGGIVILDTAIMDIAHCATANVVPPVALSGAAYTNSVQQAHAAAFALLSSGSRLDESTSGTLNGSWTLNSNSTFVGGANHFTTTPGDNWTVSVTPAQSGPLAGTVHLLTYILATSIANNAAIDYYVDGTKQGTYTPIAFEQYTGKTGAMQFGPAVVPVTVPVDGAAHTLKFQHAGSSGQRVYVDAVLVPRTSLPPIYVMQSPTPIAVSGNFTSGNITTWQANQAAIEPAVQTAIAAFPNAQWLVTSVAAAGMDSVDGYHPNDRGMRQRANDLRTAIETYLDQYAAPGSEPDVLYATL